MLSILDVQSVLEGDTYVDTEWESFNQSSSLALMRNVSMTQPMASAADVFTHNCENFSCPSVYGLNEHVISMRQHMACMLSVIYAIARPFVCLSYRWSSQKW